MAVGWIVSPRKNVEVSSPGTCECDKIMPLGKIHCGCTVSFLALIKVIRKNECPFIQIMTSD